MVKRTLRTLNIAFVISYILTLNTYTIAVGFTPFLSGFGVDANGRLYLGMDGKIDVIEDSHRVETIVRKYTQRGYAMTIMDSAYILIDTGDEMIHKLDLSGALLEEIDSAGFEDMHQTKCEPYTDVHGTVYSMKDGLMGYSIVKSEDGCETVIYKMERFPAILRLLFFPASLDGMALILYYALRGRISGREGANMDRQAHKHDIIRTRRNES